MPTSGGATGGGASGRPPEWRAEVSIDEPLVQRLLREQFPALVNASLRPFAEGWDNAVWLVDDSIVFRLPRRAIGVPGLERELRVLPGLTGTLPLPVPNPIYVGRPSNAFPWPFFGAGLLAGKEPAEMTLDGQRVAIGGALGRFLRSLHDPANVLRHGAELPTDPMGRADMTVRVPRTRERLSRLVAAGLWRPPPSVEGILAEAGDLKPAEGLALVHGDLNVRHVLLDSGGVPSAVIDWGDVCLGDPSIDLSLYWSLLDAAARAAFRDAYGVPGLTPARLLRARVLALFLNAALAEYAHDIGDAALLREAIAGLDRAVFDDKQGPPGSAS